MDSNEHAAVIQFKNSDMLVFELAIDLKRFDYKVFFPQSESSGLYLQEKTVNQINGPKYLSYKLGCPELLFDADLISKNSTIFVDA